jgi:hypothetical protein
VAFGGCWAERLPRKGETGTLLKETVIPTPWEGRWSRYDLRDGMRIPLEGEVAWMLPEGQEPYWRGRITNLTYEFVR